MPFGSGGPDTYSVRVVSKKCPTEEGEEVGTASTKSGARDIADDMRKSYDTAKFIVKIVKE